MSSDFEGNCNQTNTNVNENLHVEIPPWKKARILGDKPSEVVHSEVVTTRNASKIFYKTRMCERFKVGNCPYESTNCNFAHGFEDLRKPPPNWQTLVSSPGDDRMRKWEDDQAIINRMKICRRFSSGQECPFGKHCNFLHEHPSKFREDPPRLRESSAISIGTTGSPMDYRNTRDQATATIDCTRMSGRPICWKTKMCRKWETTGQCQFGDLCHFAHSLAEMQSFGGRNEVEAVNVGMAFGSDGAGCGATISTSTTQPSKRDIFLSKTLDQIKGIYGDWLDTLSPDHSSQDDEDN